MTMTIKNEDEIRRMDEAGQVVAIIHARIERAIAPGVTTADLDAIARDTLAESGAVSSFLGYHGFPAHICASVNDEIVHGIPGIAGCAMETSSPSMWARFWLDTTATRPGPTELARFRKRPRRCFVIRRRRSTWPSKQRRRATGWEPSDTRLSLTHGGWGVGWYAIMADTESAVRCMKIPMCPTSGGRIGGSCCDRV